LDDVFNDPPPGGGEDGFGVELHAQLGRGAMSNRHDDVAGTRERLETVRHYRGGERVVATHYERRGNSFEKSSSAVNDLRHLAVNYLARGRHSAAERFDHHLMSETDSEQRDVVGGGTPDQFYTTTGIGWSARSG